MPEGVAPSWEEPQQEILTMIDANLSLVDSKRDTKHEKMMSFDVDTLRMGGRGFCSGSPAGDKSGAKAGSTTARATNSPKNIRKAKHKNLEQKKSSMNQTSMPS